MSQVPMTEQFYIGRGVDTTTGNVFRVAIEYDQPQSANTGQEVSLMLQSITSSHELAASLSVSASASMNTGVWGGSAAFKMIKSRTVNNYYTYALVNVEVKNPALTLRNPRLTQEAEKKLREEGWDAFFSLYGSEYIEGQINGGSYYAMIEIQTRNESQQQDVKAKLSGFYGALKASAEMKETFKEISRETAVNVLVIQGGGSGDVVETTLDAMVDQAVNFPALVKDHPVSIFALTADYKSTVNLPNIPPPDSLLRINQRELLNELGGRYLKLRDYKFSLQFVLDNLIEFDEFRDFSPAQLNKKKEEFRKSLDDTANDLDMIVKNATRCSDDATQCAAYTSTATILPLPTIGGQLMSLKQLEGKLHTLESQIESLKRRDTEIEDIAIAARGKGEDLSRKDIDLGHRIDSLEQKTQKIRYKDGHTLIYSSNGKHYFVVHSHGAVGAYAVGAGGGWWYEAPPGG